MYNKIINLSINLLAVITCNKSNTVNNLSVNFEMAGLCECLYNHKLIIISWIFKVYPTLKKSEVKEINDLSTLITLVWPIPSVYPDVLFHVLPHNFLYKQNQLNESILTICIIIFKKYLLTHRAFLFMALNLWRLKRKIAYFLKRIHATIVLVKYTRKANLEKYLGSSYLVSRH